ncbi:zinc-binding dehydrogenase [Clostridiaceae bacterium 35-E11]
MKAVVKTKIGEGFIEYIDIEEPKVRKGQVKIKVSFVGVCGTDISIRHNHQWSNPPVVLGHEFSGIVQEVGAGVTNFKKGDRVISETAQVVCGTCENCMSGHYLMCKDRLSIGYGTNGAMGEYIVVREEIVHHVPREVSMEEAAMCEPSAVAYRAVFDHVDIKPIHTVAVFGPGTIGQLVAQMIKSIGAKVILCGTARDIKRLEIAKKLGINTLVIDNVDLPKYMMEQTNENGVDYAFDCSGATPAINQALNSIKRMGTLVQVGLTKPNIAIDYNLLPLKEISIVGSFGHVNASWKGVLKLMELKKLKLKPLISGKYRFEEWEKGFNAAEELDGVKVLLHP